MGFDLLFLIFKFRKRLARFFYLRLAVCEALVAGIKQRFQFVELLALLVNFNLSAFELRLGGNQRLIGVAQIA